MAETKYDLMLVPTGTGKKIYNQPWYKERLRTKYIQSGDPNHTSQFLNGKNWMFLKDGLDDFRDGLPPPTDGDVLIQSTKGISPNLKGSSDNISRVKEPAARHRFDSHQICYSRVTPLQQARRDHIEEIEYGLTQHPLALYPHLEECMPPEVFEDVVGILDPEMNLASDEDEDDVYEDDQEADSVGTPPGRAAQPVSEEQNQSDDDGKVRNPYRWLPRKEEKDKRDKKKAAERRPTSPSQDEHISAVTKEFCEWVAGLGGETNNIEESTITSLFASGYETKPALSVPIHVVELTNVPPELRMSATVPQPQQSKAQPQEQPAKEEWNHSGSYKPSWAKVNYGAWYLSPKTWKPRPDNEPLKDPQEIKDQEMSEAKKKSNALDSDLAPMHGAKAFMDFIDKKDNRRPEFLNRVAEIQEQQAREEQARLEQELAKQKKLAARRKSPPKDKVT